MSLISSYNEYMIYTVLFSLWLLVCYCVSVRECVCVCVLAAIQAQATHDRNFAVPPSPPAPSFLDSPPSVIPPPLQYPPHTTFPVTLNETSSQRSLWKQTYIHEKRPIQMKRDLYIWSRAVGSLAVSLWCVCFSPLPSPPVAFPPSLLRPPRL